MQIEILLSTMNRDNFEIAKKVNAQTDILIINQCDKTSEEEIKTEYGKIRKIDSEERGLSNSRNLAIVNSTGDVCLICDDDIVYHDNIIKKIEKAFLEIPKADIIIFDYCYHRNGKSGMKSGFKKAGKIPFYKSYGSVQIAFKRKSVVQNNLHFNPLFGTGSGEFNMGEEAIFLRECRRKGLKIYKYPLNIADVYFDESSWFRGYNEKYFFDVGAQLRASYKWEYHFLKYYYLFRMKRISELSVSDMMKKIDEGIQYYEKKYVQRK